MFSALPDQARLTEAVSRDPGLRRLAGDAFRSAVRAYATHPAALKDIFHIKRLHLGHLAYSFALRCAPPPLASLTGGAVSMRAVVATVLSEWRLARALQCSGIIISNGICMHALCCQLAAVCLSEFPHYLQGRAIHAGEVCEQGRAEAAQGRGLWPRQHGEKAT
jgi:hypothetical protein